MMNVRSYGVDATPMFTTPPRAIDASEHTLPMVRRTACSAPLPPPESSALAASTASSPKSPAGASTDTSSAASDADHARGIVIPSDPADSGAAKSNAAALDDDELAEETLD